MTPRLIQDLSTLACFLLGSAPSFAGTLTWDFTYSGSGISASGVLTTSDTLDAAFGGYDILSVSGERNGDSITGLAGPSGAITLSSDGEVIFDNVLYQSGAQVDYWGLYFGTASSGDFNVYYDNNVYYEFSDAAGLGTAPGSQVNFSATEVPEPATLGLLGLGLAAAGLIRRRKAS
jgi:hypothetical protein